MRLRRRRPEPSIFDHALATKLVAVGDAHGCPLVYYADGYGYSLVWRGDERYTDETWATIAASHHIRTALEGLLEGVPEKRLVAAPVHSEPEVIQ